MISNHMTGLAITTLPTIAGRSPGSALLLLGGFVRALGHATAAASCGVLVDRAALGRAVEDARRLGDRGLGCLAALLKSVARCLHSRARRRAGERLDRGATRRLTDALECRTLALLGCHRRRTITQSRAAYLRE